MDLRRFRGSLDLRKFLKFLLSSKYLRIWKFVWRSLLHVLIKQYYLLKSSLKSLKKSFKIKLNSLKNPSKQAGTILTENFHRLRKPKRKSIDVPELERQTWKNSVSHARLQNLLHKRCRWAERKTEANKAAQAAEKLGTKAGKSRPVIRRLKETGLLRGVFGFRKFRFIAKHRKTFFFHGTDLW